MVTTASPVKKNNIESWEHWNPKDYLETYFSTLSLGSDSYDAWEFLVRELKGLKEKPERILDFGSGPTLFGVIPCAPYVSEIHMCDYLDCNINAIKAWINEDADMFNWNNCIAEVLKIEGVEPTNENVKKRATELREKISCLQHCDAGKACPLDKLLEYPLIISTYCLDSATSSKNVWNVYMNNMLTLLANRGTLLLTALRKCKTYNVGKMSFPSANIDEIDVEDALLRNGFKKENISIQICDAPDCADEGFSGLIFVRAEKS